MSTAAAPTAAPTLPELARQFPSWLKAHVPSAVGSAVAGGIFAYVVNVWLMAVRYNGWQKVPSGAPATGKGNLLGGAMFWAVATSVIFGVVGYWRAVGTKRFLHDLRDLPMAIATLIRRDGTASRIHLLWGAAISLLAAQILSPAVGAMLAVGLLASAPGVLGNIISSLVGRIWSSGVERFAPERQQRQPAMLSLTVGLVGASAALLIGFVIHNSLLKLLLAAACGGAAVALSKRSAPPPVVQVFLLVLGAFALNDLFHAVHAFANDGGEKECGIKVYQVGKWLSSCSGSKTIIAYGRPGGVAGAVGAPIGGFLGHVAGGFGRGRGGTDDPGGGNDGPPDHGPIVEPNLPIRPRVFVKGGSVYVVGADGTMIAAPINANGTVGTFGFAGREVDPPLTAAGAANEPPPEPVIDTTPPDRWDLSNLFGDDPPPPATPGQPVDGAANPPPGPDLVVIGSILNAIDNGINWTVADPNLFTQIENLRGRLATGNFGPEDFAALNNLEGAINADAANVLARIRADQAKIADEGMNFIDAKNTKDLADEAARRAAMAAIDKQEQWIINHMDELPPGQVAAIQNLLGNLNEVGDTAGAQAKLKQLTNSIFNTMQGASEGEAAAATADAIRWNELATGASRISTAATLAEAALLFPFLVPGAAAAATQLGGFFLGRNLIVGAAEGYVEGGIPGALYGGAKGVLPINLAIAIANGDTAGAILLATLRDIGNVAQLGAAAEALQNMSRAQGPVDTKAIRALNGEGPPPRMPVTPQDEAWLAARQKGQDNVKKFMELSDEVKVLKAGGAPPETIARAEAELNAKVFEMNGDYQAKATLKGMPSDVQKDFTRALEPALQDAQAGTVKALNDAGYTRGGRPIIADDLVDLRNANSIAEGTVGMDRDLALNQLAERQLQTQLDRLPPNSPAAQTIRNQLNELAEHGMSFGPDGKPLLDANGRIVTGGKFELNGEHVTPTDVRGAAQDAYNDSYRKATGHDAREALQGVTDSTHPEAYHDLNALANDPAKRPFDPRWADQTGSVTPYKGMDLIKEAGNDPVKLANAIQETARGTAKDINGKLMPLLEANGGNPAAVERMQNVKDFLTDVGNGKYMPSEAQALASQRFGTDVQGLANQVGSNIAASVQRGQLPAGMGDFPKFVQGSFINAAQNGPALIDQQAFRNQSAATNDEGTMRHARF